MYCGNKGEKKKDDLTCTEGYTYKCTVPNCHFRASPLVIKNPTVSPHGELCFDVWVSACTCVSDVYIIFTIMHCNGEYVQGVVVGPKRFRTNEFWHAAWRLPLARLCLAPGPYYLAMDVGRRREREVHRQTYFIVRHSPVHAVCDDGGKKKKVPYGAPTTSVSCEVTIEPATPVTVSGVHVTLFDAQGHAVAHDDRQTFTPPLAGSPQSSAAHHPQPHEVDVVVHIPRGLCGCYRAVLAFVDEAGIVCASCYTYLVVLPSHK